MNEYELHYTVHEKFIELIETEWFGRLDTNERTSFMRELARRATEYADDEDQF